ncbi:Hypothetical predicted protein [Octopus vulgaris]|uniref:Uncharacterized protein n=1 Tax=Octopus vulgaris TaxID=6645 RepID=A0AA36AEU8_OCTVU|nr:Hypothetical predicted protein [Octopus vulgaris]
MSISSNNPTTGSVEVPMQKWSDIATGVIYHVVNGALVYNVGIRRGSSVSISSGRGVCISDIIIMAISSCVCGRSVNNSTAFSNGNIAVGFNINIIAIPVSR